MKPRGECKNMKILFTGSTGMVGKNFFELPNKNNYEFLTPSSRELNLLDYNQVENFLLENKPDLIIHCAGKVAGIQANINNPVDFLILNLDMGRNIIMAAYKTGIKKVINVGSSCMYPRNGPNPLKEEYLLQGELEPTNEGYALAKIATSKLCEYIMKENPSFQFKTIVPCNLYGKWDKFDLQNSHMIPAAIRKIHTAKENNDSHVEIWGDGEARREFMFVTDLADFLYKTIEEFDSLPNFVNVGLGYDYSVNEYYQKVAEIIGWEGKFIHNLTKPYGMKQKVVNIEKLTKWGWKASTSLEEGIRKTYEFYLEIEIIK